MGISRISGAIYAFMRISTRAHMAACFYHDVVSFFSYEFGKGIQFRHTGEKKKERRMVEFRTIYGQVSICRTDDGRTDR